MSKTINEIKEESNTFCFTDNRKLIEWDFRTGKEKRRDKRKNQRQKPKK